ncbi:hypothetical protein JXB27_00615 [Candidatus Woesearchaeota archaeon]|nr:hypothetical protein [Candidatus Woesearchaeota archaeon]
MKKFLILILLIILSSSAYAQKNTIKLLAVSQETNEGTAVDLDLTVIDGSGKIFMETYPLSQIDTQISLRVAKMIACETSKEYCLDKDFMYSMKTASPVIAGPSAGAAMTLLTMASLENKNLDAHTVITGTINSGGVIGPVGAIKEKVKAAENAGMKKVLIPGGELNSSEIDEIKNESKISLIEVSNIDEAYAIFTGTNKENKEIVVDAEYQSIMRSMNREICERNEELLAQIKDINDSAHEKIKKMAINLSEESKILYSEGKFYSSSSRCFGSNVYAREILSETSNSTNSETQNQSLEIQKKLIELEKFLNSTKITNLGQLEAAMIIRERIFDARDNLKEGNTSKRSVSYALERAYSADSWKNFMEKSGKNIDETKLKESCSAKINEVNELYNYVSIYTPSLLKETKEELDNARSYLKTEDYALCLFKASKSKADIDVLLGALYASTSDISYLVDSKILAAKNKIIKQIESGTFPVLGYSYYEYATALKDKDQYMALLYAEYGIELSNLDIYFPQKKPFEFKIDFLLGAVSLFVIFLCVFALKKQHKRRITLK